MKHLIHFLLICFSFASSAQEKDVVDPKTWVAPYFLDTPKDWGTEHFVLPANFAPSIPYKGVEDIRFTPGWGRKESVEYWSYAFLWYLDSTITLDAETIEKDLSAYYTGLLHANLDTSRITAERIKPAVVEIKKIKATGNAEQSFEGDVHTLDFLTWQPIILNIRIHRRTCSDQNKTFIFHEVSPKSFTDPVWKRLDELWISLRCLK